MGHFVGINSLYIYSKNKKYIDIFFLDKKISNYEIYRFLYKKLIFVPKLFTPIFHRILNTNLKYKIIKELSFHYDVNNNLIRKIFECRDTSNLIDKTNIYFKYSKVEEEEIKKKNKYFYNLDKIVCLHVRDDGFLNKNLKNYIENKSVNSKISTYLKTVKKLNMLGYTVIRVGKDHKNFLKYKNRNYIDLFQENLWNSELELYLISKCNFFIGTHSGGSMASLYLFRKPTLFTNFIPLGKVFSYSKNILFIPKKIKFKNKYLSISEIFNKKAEGLEKLKDLKKKNLSIIDNTPEEIYLATQDMINYLKNEKKYLSKNSKNLFKFKKSFEINLKKSKLMGFHGELRFNIAVSFLSKNKFLLK